VGKNIIELNGKRYDALTGSLLGKSTAAPMHKPAGTFVGHRGRFIDGFVKTPKRVGGSVTQSPAFISVQPAPEKVTHAKSRSHAPAKHLPAHRPEHTKTLMRSVVSRPQIIRKPLIKTQAPAEMMPAPIATIVPKLSASQVNPGRLERAQDVKKSETIKKFNPGERATALARATVTTPARPHPAISPATNRATTGTASRAIVPAAKPDIFETAIARATSHEQPQPTQTGKRRHGQRRLINMTAGIAAVLIITGFVGYLNAPNIELRIASLQAGFHASLPSYEPVGYAMARSISTHNNQVAVRFNSGNGTSFKLTQQPSSWDSSTLYDNLIATTNTAHQTIESNGRTIYMFGNTNAAWVNSGVLYQIIGTAELSNNQVSQIAASM